MWTLWKKTTSKFIDNLTDYLYCTEQLQGKSTIIIAREEIVAQVYVISQNNSPSSTQLDLRDTFSQVHFKTKRCYYYTMSLLGVTDQKSYLLFVVVNNDALV